MLLSICRNWELGW